jgi:hypothetical protein
MEFSAKGEHPLAVVYEAVVVPLNSLVSQSSVSNWPCYHRIGMDGGEKRSKSNDNSCPVVNSHLDIAELCWQPSDATPSIWSQIRLFIVSTSFHTSCLHDQTSGRNLTIMIDQKAGFIPPVVDCSLRICAYMGHKASPLLLHTPPKTRWDSMDRENSS